MTYVSNPIAGLSGWVADLSEQVTRLNSPIANLSEQIVYLSNLIAGFSRCRGDLSSRGAHLSRTGAELSARAVRSDVLEVGGGRGLMGLRGSRRSVQEQIMRTLFGLVDGPANIGTVPMAGEAHG